jgi:DNA-directed RNA polymerase subunit omega
MARITVEDCLKRVENRFALIHLAAKRVRQLRKGSEPLVISKNKDVVISLREIAAGKIVKTDRSREALLEDIMDLEPKQLAEPAEVVVAEQQEGDPETLTEEHEEIGKTEETKETEETEDKS